MWKQSHVYRMLCVMLHVADVDTRTGSGSQPKECLSKILIKAIEHELKKEDRINDSVIQEDVRRSIESLHLQSTTVEAQKDSRPNGS